MEANDIEDLEVELLFQAIYRRYDWDFRDYAKNSARRRVQLAVQQGGYRSIGDLQHSVLVDEGRADALLKTLSINVTEMFRDPPFFKDVRTIVIPALQKLQHCKIWHAGCATGEEVYSMAILLREAEIYERAILYATDFNAQALDNAKQGMIPLQQMRTNISNYQLSGGQQPFSNYYYAQHGYARLDTALKKQLCFSLHDLTIDQALSGVDVVFCRNVIIYFNKILQERVLNMFYNALPMGGFLCLGSSETLALTALQGVMQKVSGHAIYRKVA